jgi:hypothetical protein
MVACTNLLYLPAIEVILAARVNDEGAWVNNGPFIMFILH